MTTITHRGLLLGPLLAAVLSALPGHAAETAEHQAPRLAVCADPDNLPFSSSSQEGFENRIARLIADDLHAQLRYTWSEQRRGFIRRTLQAGQCDVIMGLPPGLPGVSLTRPYYVSSYVFVTRADAAALTSFDDPRLARWRIGLEAIGVEGANTPPARALARRGLSAKVVGFSRQDAGDGVARAARMVNAVASGEIDVAVLWGPFGGYFARSAPAALRVTVTEPDPQQPDVAFAYPISIGVREADEPLRIRLQDVLDRRQAEIRAILADHGVPLLSSPVAMASHDGPGSH